MMRSRAINTFGLGMTAVVLVIVLVTKFLAGAWITILAMGVFYAIMVAIRRHYDRVEEELVIEDSDPFLPTRVHAIVLVSKLHKPTMRALAYAKASRPNILEAVFVDAEGGSSNKLVDEWDAQRIDVPLKMLYSPYREVIRPIVQYAAEIRRGEPARRRRGLHPRVRRRPLVGAAAAQPDRAPAQGPAAVHARRDGDLGALPAARFGEGQEARRPRPATAATRRRTTWPHPVGTVTASEDSLVGERFEVEVGPVAHGGHFVARVATGFDERQLVIFVRHALPGEQVTVEVTEDSGRFLRGDAVHVSVPSPHRVRAPCPLAHPGGCGGCDFQHVELAEQRRLKASVVEEQLSRLAGLEREVVVEPVPGDQDGLSWRTRMQYVHLPGGDKGLRKHRSHDVVLVDRCLIAHPGCA